MDENRRPSAGEVLEGDEKVIPAFLLRLNADMWLAGILDKKDKLGVL